VGDSAARARAQKRLDALREARLEGTGAFTGKKCVKKWKKCEKRRKTWEFV